MRILTFVPLLLGASLVSEATVAPLATSFMEPEKILEELKSRSDLTSGEVLNLLKQADDVSRRLHNRHSIKQYLDISEREPKLCTVQELRQIVELHQYDVHKDVELAIRDNISRYCRQQFNELFEYCLRESNGEAYPERIKNLYSESSNKAGENVHEMTKLEQFVLLGYTTEEIQKRLRAGYTCPTLTQYMLDRAYDDSGILMDGFTIKDYKSTLSRDPSLCTVKELSQRIVMHHGSDSREDTRIVSTTRDNLTHFCRKHFNELVKYCLNESGDEQFKKLVGELFIASNFNANRQHVGLLTSMEWAILKVWHKQESV